MKNYCRLLVVIGLTLSLHGWVFAADRILGTTNGTGTAEELTPSEAVQLMGLDGGLDGQFNINPQITGATTASPLRVGNNASAQTDACSGTDATLGGFFMPCAAANTRTPIMTNFNWCLFDLEGAACVLTADPDAFSTGSGTLTMQTGHQFIGSNLGIEFSESDTNPTCASGNYTLYADTSEAALKQCANGTRYTIPQSGFTRKTSDETVNNSTTIQDDDVLSFPVSANSFYTFRIQLIYSSATAADFKYDSTLPSGATGWKSSVHPPIGATACTGTSTTNAFNDVTAVNVNVGGAGTGSANACFIEISGQVTTAGTAGTFQFQWAQVTADATDTVVYAGSNIEWVKR